MIDQNSYVYVRIGLCLRLLRNLAATTKPEHAKKEIGALMSNLQKAGFEVSLAATKSGAYSEMTKALDEAEPDKPLPAALLATIRSQFESLETVVFPEATTKKLYMLPARRFNTDYLLSDPSKLLKRGAFEKLDFIAQTDFSSSCRCLLFGEATAAAFHILRATESVLKHYYYHHRKQNRLANPMWGPMVAQLRSKTRNRPSESLLTSLDLIRTAYRNPTQHPEATYEVDNAQDLFGVCIDAIGKMADELPAKA